MSSAAHRFDVSNFEYLLLFSIGKLSLKKKYLKIENQNVQSYELPKTLNENHRFHRFRIRENM